MLDPEARHRLAQVGAEVSEERVRFDPDLVTEWVAQAPSEFTFHGRVPARDVHIGGDHLATSTVGSAPMYVTLDGVRRSGDTDGYRDNGDLEKKDLGIRAGYDATDLIDIQSLEGLFLTLTAGYHDDDQGFPGGVPVEDVSLYQRHFRMDLVDDETAAAADLFEKREIPVDLRDRNDDGQFNAGDGIVFWARSVRDLAAANAFFKPGPATGGMAQAFVRRYRGEEPVTFLHPALAPILGPTQGVLLFQEQILRVAREIAGLSWAQADRLRRGMSHFGHQEMADLEAQLTAAEAVFGQHPFNCSAYDLFRFFFQQFSGRNLFESSNITAVMIIFFIVPFVPGHCVFFGVDDHDKIARIGVGREYRLVLSSQTRGDLAGKPSENPVFGIHQVPLSVYFLFLGHEGFHWFVPN